MLRAYRQTGPVGSALTPPKPDGISELLYQIQKFHGFLWASGGCFSDFFIHNIDECCWMKDAWPVSAKGSGGRDYRGDYIDQNFDTYSVEYTFADGTKLFLEGRNIDGCDQEFASYAHGTKGSAVISSNSHSPARCRIYKGQKFTRSDVVWAFPQPEPNPYQVEWDDLIHAIKKDKLYNEVKRGAEASLVTAMGRMAAHTGQIITFDEMLNCKSRIRPRRRQAHDDQRRPRSRWISSRSDIRFHSRGLSGTASTWFEALSTVNRPDEGRAMSANAQAPDGAKLSAGRARRLQRYQGGLRTLIALVACCGVLLWAWRVLRDKVDPALADTRAIQERAIHALRSPDASTRATAIRDLVALPYGESAVVIPQLLDRLGDSEANIRISAASALGTYGNKAVQARTAGGEVSAAIAALVRSLNDEQPEVRLAATNALGMMTGSSYTRNGG